MDRPILFSAPMVRALLAGTKTQTRRVVKPRKDRDMGCELAPSELAGEVNGGEFRNAYCAPGDRLWVRETHMDLGACYLYRADLGAETERALVAPGQRWRPAIHMPRAASRITLEVTGVGVEKLSDISREDALAEGIGEAYGGFGLPDGSHFHAADPRESYWSLWEAINGTGSVAADPLVWVVKFSKLQNG